MIFFALCSVMYEPTISQLDVIASYWVRSCKSGAYQYDSQIATLAILYCEVRASGLSQSYAVGFGGMKRFSERGLIFRMQWYNITCMHVCMVPTFSIKGSILLYSCIANKELQ